MPCEYFTDFGNNGVPGTCEEPAALELIDHPAKYPRIRVCLHHAHVIVSRFPELGGVEERFAPIQTP